MELPRLQYITHPQENFDDLAWVHRLHENGVKWIQLRLKEEDVILRFPDRHYKAYFHEIADRMRAVTEALDMVLTINDAVDVALFSHADGLHVGQDDDLVAVQTGYDPQKGILGGTANSASEVVCLDQIGVHYFGVGPFRMTSTKTTLKPVLGIDGYIRLLQFLEETGRLKPVFAIGGITPEDVAPLLQAGVYGIAVSGAIFHSGHAPEIIRSFTKVCQDYESTIGK